jgi:hypothetical protein
MIVKEKPVIAGFSYTIGFSFTIIAGEFDKLAYLAVMREAQGRDEAPEAAGAPG